MNGEALAYLIDTCKTEIADRVKELQSETKTNEIAIMQGAIKGYKFLIDAMAKSFELDEDFLNAKTEIPLSPEKLQSVELTDLFFDFETMLTDERWSAVMDVLEDNELEMGSMLLHEAKNARIMKVCQGKLEAQTTSTKLFEKITEAKERMDKREEYVRRNPSLPFNEVDVPEIEIEDLP